MMNNKEKFGTWWRIPYMDLFFCQILVKRFANKGESQIQMCNLRQNVKRPKGFSFQGQFKRYLRVGSGI